MENDMNSFQFEKIFRAIKNAEETESPVEGLKDIWVGTQVSTPSGARQLSPEGVFLHLLAEELGGLAAGVYASEMAGEHLGGRNYGLRELGETRIHFVWIGPWERTSFELNFEEAVMRFFDITSGQLASTPCYPQMERLTKVASLLASQEKDAA